MGLALLLLAGCLGSNPPLILGGDVNGTDINVNYITSETLSCGGDGRLCMDWNGSDGLIG